MGATSTSASGLTDIVEPASWCSFHSRPRTWLGNPTASTATFPLGRRRGNAALLRLTFAVVIRFVMIETGAGGTKKPERVPKGWMFAIAKIDAMELGTGR